MVGRQATSRPRRRGLGLAAGLLAVGVAGSAAVLIAVPASAEASSTTATLTVTGVVDSNCVVSTGGNAVYVAPGGSIDFKAALAGMSLNLGLLGTVALNTSTVASFVDTLVIDNDTAHPHQVTGTQDYVYSGVSGNHTFSWTASSVQLLPAVAGGITVALNANNVTLPVGGKLTWNGTVDTSKTTTCGLSAQLPGVQASAGPVKVSIPPIALPSVSVPTALPTNLTGLIPGLGGTPGPGANAPGADGGLGYHDPGQQVPADIVPRGGGNGLFGQGSPGGGGGGAGGVKANGADASGALPAGAAGTPGSSPSGANTVDLSAKKTSAAQIPVVLAILAILALSLVSAAYARMYLIRRTA